MYRWAAKEAAIKASKPRKVFPKEIEILSNESMEHYALIFDRQAPTLDSKGYDVREYAPSTGLHQERSAQEARISITHDGEYAFAVALVPEVPAQPS